MKKMVLGIAGLLICTPSVLLADHHRHTTHVYVAEHHNCGSKHGKGHKKHKHSHGPHKAYHRDIREQAFGRVLEVEPVVRYTAISQHPASCLQLRGDGSAYRSFTPTVLGGVIGSALGYRLADDHGDPEVATIAAALLGASVGRDVGRRLADSRAYAVEGPCVPAGQREVRAEPLEYIVTYRYNGQTYRTRMDRDPGDWIALDVDVKPA